MKNREITSNTGDKIKAENSKWSFAGDVPKNFDAHVSKSVPLYSEGHDLILKISDFFLSESSTCIDLGCSTGFLASQIATRHTGKGVKVIAIDVEPDMISFAKSKYSKINDLEFFADSIAEAEFANCDMIISYYTIQFIKPRIRQLIIDKIYRSLNWGGAFVLFEKVRGPDARFQDITSSLYTDYKLDMGYSPENIVSKSRSLKGVLEPFSTQGNLDLLKRAGFTDIMTVMKYVCFEGFLAIK